MRARFECARSGPLTRPQPELTPDSPVRNACKYRRRQSSGSSAFSKKVAPGAIERGGGPSLLRAAPSRAAPVGHLKTPSADSRHKPHLPIYSQPGRQEEG